MVSLSCLLPHSDQRLIPQLRPRFFSLPLYLLPASALGGGTSPSPRVWYPSAISFMRCCSTRRFADAYLVSHCRLAFIHLLTGPSLTMPISLGWRQHPG